MNWIDVALQTTMPEAMAALPRNERGLPIPFSVHYDASGKPYFRVIDMAKWELAVAEQLCGVCGRKLGYYKFFIGGPKCVKNRAFLNLPMHEHCARYPLSVCPYLALPRFAHAKVEAPRLAANHEIIEHPMLSTERPERFVLYKTRKFQ